MLRNGDSYNDAVTYRDPTVSKIVPCEDIPFGKWFSRPKERGLQKSQLHLTVAGDDDIFWISDRMGHAMRLDRAELLELLTMLNKRMPLDSLGSI